ncbi:MAG: hypothetical protein ACLGIN_13570 [Candidatus Sericytochromatia bacterium]
MKRPTWWLLLMGATGLTACDPLTTLPAPPGAAAPIVAPERPAPLVDAPAEAPVPEPEPAPAAEPLPEPAAESEMRWWSFDDWRDYWGADDDDDEDDEKRKKKGRKDG